MSTELVINSTRDGARIALLKEKKIVEYHVEQDETKFAVGDIYLGIIRKVVPGLNAAFVDIGYQKDAFLHYLDLGPNIRSLLKYTKDTIAKRQQTHRLDDFKFAPPIEKIGKISQVLSRNTPILVQVTKEPISTKGPRLSCELSIAGRYLVLVPFSNTISISKRIVSKEEKQRLTRLIQSIKPARFGVIVRTAAEGREVAELDSDLRQLVEKWEKGFETLKNAKPRDKVIGEVGRVSSILRDLLNENFDNIATDSKPIYEEIRTLVKRISPKQEKIVKLHNGKTKIFESFGIEKQLKLLFGKSVSLSSGGYLVIEHTEALHVIDVNSGNKSVSEASQEATALAVNLEAVKEISRQLRIRDMGGIIIVDFIDMKKVDNKKTIYRKMKEVMMEDRAKHTILPLTRFGLMQITRQRVRPELNIKTLEICPACNGTGKITASILISDTIENNLDYIIQKQNEKGLTITSHPYLHAYFTHGLISRQMKWLFKYGRWIKVIKDSSLPLNEFIFRNKDGVEIEV
ncbi:MAG: Rne/Rng family ribonuclease [Bacteroidota bacterium]